MRKKNDLLICFLVVQLFVNFVAQPIRVVGDSMYPTYEDGSIGLVNRFLFNEDKLERFDTVVLKYEDEYIIKRLIGFPGETVEMKDDVLTIDGVVYDEYYLDDEYVEQMKEKYNTDKYTTDFTIILGEDEYFVLGDNRIISYDSRLMGPFSFDDFVGSGVVILYPFDKFGIYD